VLVCAVIFYFVNRCCSKFEFEFKSKEFEFIKEFVNWKAFFLVPYGHGPKPSHRGPGSLPLRHIQVVVESSQSPSALASPGESNPFSEDSTR
jgi:hypothetical protein